MMDYDLINMSDRICFRAPDLQIATLVTILLGNGQYAAEAYDADGDLREGADVPFFMLGGFDDFWEGNWPDDALDGIIERRKADLITALRSVMLGTIGDRQMYDRACEAIDDPAKLDAFRAEWNDRKRSSLNDIMGRAHSIADKLEGKPTGPQAQRVPPQVFVG